MKCCPRCQARYVGTPQVCPIDGAPLQDVLHPRIGTQIDRWQIDDCIAEGPYTTLFRVSDVAKRDATSRSGALKLYHQLQRRFDHEVKALARIVHPAIAMLYDTGHTTNSEHYIVTEWVPGPSLRDCIKQPAAGLTCAQAVQFTITIAQGLSAIHDADVLHRDLKPENIALTQQPIHRPIGSSVNSAPISPLKILDFGHAKLLEADRLTDSGWVWGSAAYMSPEQAMSQPMDARSDLYALGVIFYELLTGRLPFHAKADADVLQLHCTAAPIRPTQFVHVPRPVEELCLWLLEKNPTQRPTSGHVVAAALQATQME